jgi:hypothetical protein
VDVITTGKISEQGMVIKLPLKRVSFFIGPASCRFTREAVEWQTAGETIAILDAAVSALIRSSAPARGAGIGPGYDPGGGRKMGASQSDD